ncbi:MAG: hypothetical protein AABX90_02380 [Nanoarchaeota archaeon]
MGLFSWLKSIFSSKKEEQDSELFLDSQPQNNQPERKQEQYVRKQYTKIPRTQETNKYVQSIVKKAYSQDFKPKPLITLPDAKEIERITNKLKEDSFKRNNFR